MLFVDLNDNFSMSRVWPFIVQLFSSAVEKTQCERLSLVGLCAVTLPATGMDKTDNLPIGINETIHMPQLIMLFTSFDDFILPLENT